MNSSIRALERENIEIELLLDAIYHKYGYDFRNYTRSYIKRRVLNRKRQERIERVLDMVQRVLDDEMFADSLLTDFSINVTEIFRDPSFYKAFREKVVPHLQTYPFLKIWHAGCATGEEVYSMAILLHEEGLLKRSQLYATDFNLHVLEKAKTGIYEGRVIHEFENNYRQSGGTLDLSNYYFEEYDVIRMHSFLREKIIFAEHNLVTDKVFGEMHCVICRNVLIYFNKDLQNHVLHLFHESLCPAGFLCLGIKESLQFSECELDFDIIDDKQKIFRKKYEYD